MKRLLASCALVALTLAFAIEPTRSQDAPRPAKRPSVIFFIGDGMGISQVTLGRVVAQHRGEPYHLDRFRTIGLAGTRSADWVVTDSAASATALASGFKTKNQVVGLDPQGKPVKGLVEVAHEQGLATGVVTTTRITHATPAGFIAHVAHRDMEEEIAGQLVAAARQGWPDVLIGGGRRYFKAAEQQALREAGYTLVTDAGALAAAEGPRLAALLDDTHYPYAIDRAPGAPDLAAFTRKAVEVLSAKGPFVLMVEGGRVDHACHEHDAAACAHDQLDLDRAVGWALDEAERRGDLLVVVTADHATGDLGIAETVKLDGLLAVTSSAEKLTRDVLKVDDAAATAAWVAEVEAKTGLELTPEQVRTIWGPPDKYFARTKLGHLVSSKYGVEFYDVELQEAQHTNTHGHDGAMVGVFAAGPGAERFAGVYENTELPRRIAEVLQLPLQVAAGAQR